MEPHDVSEIGQVSRGKQGFVGFIYLDGDNMGKAFENINTADNARLLSQTIRINAIQAVFESIASLLAPARIHPSQGRKGTRDQPKESELDAQGRILIYPFEIITIGGDDILILVPADSAIPLACQISQEFQNTMHQHLAQFSLPSQVANQPFTLSGGVVLADDHNPVRTLRDLSRELKASAKRNRHRQQVNEGYIDFVALMGTDIPDRSLRKSRQLYPYLIEQPGFQPISLLGRPYPVSRLKTAWESLKTLQSDGFAKSQMSALAEALLRGVQESALFYKYQHARIGGFDHLDSAVRVLQGRQDKDPVDPWVIPTEPARISAYTVLWDLAELYSLVP